MRTPLLHGALWLAALLASACDDGAKTANEGRADAATEDASDARDAADAEDAGAPDCFEDPRTHEELINACTDAEKVEKEPTLPLLLSDGGLPPLP